MRSSYKAPRVVSWEGKQGRPPQGFVWNQMGRWMESKLNYPACLDFSLYEKWQAVDCNTWAVAFVKFCPLSITPFLYKAEWKTWEMVCLFPHEPFAPSGRSLWSPPSTFDPVCFPTGVWNNIHRLQAHTQVWLKGCHQSHAYNLCQNLSRICSVKCDPFLIIGKSFGGKMI